MFTRFDWCYNQISSYLRWTPLKLPLSFLLCLVTIIGLVKFLYIFLLASEKKSQCFKDTSILGKTTHCGIFLNPTFNTHVVLENFQYFSHNSTSVRNNESNWNYVFFLTKYDFAMNFWSVQCIMVQKSL